MAKDRVTITPAEVGDLGQVLKSGLTRVMVQHTAEDRGGDDSLFTLDHEDGEHHTAFDPGQVKTIELSEEMVTRLRSGQLQYLKEVKPQIKAGSQVTFVDADTFEQHGIKNDNPT